MRTHVLRRIFSTDHRVIGLQYGFTSMFFLLVGFALVLIIRWQHAYSGQPLPMIGGLLGETNAPGGIISPEFYNQLGAMHGTIMVFLGVVPLAFGAFGNYIVRLQIVAPDMASGTSACAGCTPSRRRPTTTRG
jgi:cytochrome c oxidase subunit 1